MQPCWVTDTAKCPGISHCSLTPYSAANAQGLGPEWILIGVAWQDRAPLQTTLLCSLQIEGPNVAPLTVGKQNLIVYVLRQLEKHFFEVNQFFRIHNCSHEENLHQANVSLAIVTHNDITVGLDVVCGLGMLCAFWLVA